jgi:hypothetical protein
MHRLKMDDEQVQRGTGMADVLIKAMADERML